MDLATKSNLANLVKIGEKLLKNRVVRMNIDTGVYEPVPEDITNDQQLKRWLRSFKICWWVSWIESNLVVVIFVNVGLRKSSRSKGNQREWEATQWLKIHQTDRKRSNIIREYSLIITCVFVWNNLLYNMIFLYSLKTDDLVCIARRILRFFFFWFNY